MLTYIDRPLKSTTLWTYAVDIRGVLGVNFRCSSVLVKFFFHVLQDVVSVARFQTESDDELEL